MGHGVGSLLGVCEGAWFGAAVGSTVVLGEAVGCLVGISEGASVGLSVGAAVVGTTVG